MGGGDKSSFFIARESQMTIDESDSRGDLVIRAKRIFVREMGINYTRISKSADWPRSKSTIISIVGEIMIPFGNRLCVSRNCDAFAKQSNRPRVVEQIERAQLAYESRGNGRNRISLILPRASSLYLSSITRLPSFREPFVRKMRKERGREREQGRKIE